TPVVPPRPPLPVVPAVLPPTPVVPDMPPAPIVPPMPPEPVVVTQVPVAHEPAHVMPQPPQFVLVFVGTHDEPQSISPPLQAQVLPAQVAPAGQACPQDPQLALSVARFAQPVEHIISLVMHPEAQLPPLHTCGDVQVRPHMPQLALFDGTHMLLQESWPAPQTHAPD